MTILSIDPTNKTYENLAIEMAIKANPIRWFLQRHSYIGPIVTQQAIYGDMTDEEKKTFEHLLLTDRQFSDMIFNFVHTWLHNFDLTYRCWQEANGLL